MSFPAQTTTKTPDLKEQLAQIGLVAMADCIDASWPAPARAASLRARWSRRSPAWSCDWNTVFPNATSIATLLDKLTHHADVTMVEGDNYRVH